ncbi:kinase-like protein [Coccomyxa subellipsoidea C-169]|uniref:Kinase-like protein n=1 Tax=Coccomyxa subellipsoidea (strain C-169) TaxID=574566 RepID=I0YR90_COCSC|nr:kinase-like protein [Coccomyxa subellipsoidea C-169]EIE20909.1 kinase-like protein [Coccomyxa subellipsoidea C-169]|eukprot:XP_005645453.1 kinase-like protein [Coccomyxa subellipsoidea C-169]
MRSKKCTLPCIGRPLVLDNDYHEVPPVEYLITPQVRLQGRSVRSKFFARPSIRPDPSASSKAQQSKLAPGLVQRLAKRLSIAVGYPFIFNNKVDPGVRDAALEELPHIRQQLLAANEQNAILRQNAALFAGQLGQKEAAARASEQEAALLRQQLTDADEVHRIEMEEKDSQLQQMVAREAKAKKAAQAARSLLVISTAQLKDKTGLLKEKEAELAAARDTIRQKEAMISLLKQMEEDELSEEDEDTENESDEEVQDEEAEQGSCTVTGEVGEGGCATILSVNMSYEAVAKVARRFKDKDQTQDAERDLHNEAQVLSVLPPHPALVKVFGWASIDNPLTGTPQEAVIMEGRLTGRPMETLKALLILYDLCKGVAHLWGHGYIHRDIKPPNILMYLDGCAKLADFGSAMLEDDPCTEFSGTPLYCTSDSYLDMTASQQDDKRALCATACELLTGGEVPDELRDQYDRLSEAQKELAEAEFLRGAEQCQCTDICYDDRVTAAERLGLIGITEVVPLDKRLPAELLEDILLGIQDPSSLPLSCLQANIMSAISKISQS